MKLNEEQYEKVIELAKPLAQWLADNCHPHVKVIVENDRIELMEGVMECPLDTIIPD